MSSRFLLLIMLFLLTAGCGHMQSRNNYWGKNATVTPGWQAVKRAAVEAAVDPFTWVPAFGAAALQIGNADRDFTENIRRDKPVFGSAKDAEDASDWLRFGSIAVYAGLGLAAPAPPDPAEWRRAKGKGFLTGAVALAATSGVTDGLKVLTSRTRPNREDDESLPSGHVSTTTVAARLSAETLDYYELNQAPRFAAKTGLASITFATAWARLEAGKHFPADVLLGVALGNFIARFTTRAFLHPVRDEGSVVQVEPLPDGGFLTFTLAY